MAGIEALAELDLTLSAAAKVLDPHPVAFGEAVLLGRGGIELDDGIGPVAAKLRNLTVLGMEQRPIARARRQDERVVLVHVGVGDGTRRRPLEARNRVHPYLVEVREPQLDAAGRDLETHVAALAQHAHGERGVGAGTQRQMELCLRAKPSHLKGNGDELRAALQAVGDPVTVQAVGIRHDGVVPSENDEFGAFPTRIVVAVAELL